MTNVRTNFSILRNFESSLLPLQILAELDLLQEEHFSGAKSSAEVLEKALNSILRKNCDNDSFSTSMEFKAMDYGYFFSCVTTDAPCCITLEPIYLQIKEVRDVERIMATFSYNIDYGLSAVALCFDYEAAKGEYDMHCEMLEDSREDDDEGVVNEAADPSEGCPEWIKQRVDYRFRTKEEFLAAIELVKIDSIKALLKLSQDLCDIRTNELKLAENETRAREAAREDVMDGDHPIALGISFNRYDGTVAWLDDYANSRFENGVDFRPWIVRGFDFKDKAGLKNLFENLPVISRMFDIASRIDVMGNAVEKEYELRGDDWGAARVRTEEGAAVLREV